MKTLFKKIKNKLKFYLKTRYSKISDYKKYCNKPKYKALIYFKTDVFKPNYTENFSHTNNWEISEMVKILNKLGFVVDIIDRKISEKFLPQNKYDLFIGNAAGNSGKYYSKYAKILKKAVKIFYAAGPDPETSNKLILKRYDYLNKRFNKKYKLDPRRMINKGGGTLTKILYTDYIFAIGNIFSINTYKKYGKKTFQIYPSSSPKIKFDKNKINKKNKNNFLYFGGSGNIVKGLDLLIETFSELPELNLYVCAPTDEEEFNFIYKNILNKSTNIKIEGFVNVESELFNEITSKCSFIILPSCSEGTATSVTTCMRKGLIPVVTYESGIDTGDFGFIINSIKIEDLKKQVREISKIPDTELKKRILETYEESKKYTQENFTKSFKEAMEKVMKENNLL